jgi:hypothetical protein
LAASASARESRPSSSATLRTTGGHPGSGFAALRSQSLGLPG